LALPSGFNSWIHLRRVIRQIQNDLVQQEFSDLDNIPDSIDTPRASLREACKIRGDESAKIIDLKLYLFYIILRKAKDLHPPIYAVPQKKAVIRRDRPQVKLYFLEDYQDVEAGESPVEGEISFRLMNETTQSMTQAKTQQLANKIATDFASGSRFIWRKGRNGFNYTDWEAGYQLQLFVRDRAEGRRVVSAVLGLNNDVPDWTKATYTENEDPTNAYPYNPGYEQILGEQKRRYRRRPIVDVRFHSAFLFLSGVPNPVVLVDTQILYKNPIVRTI
jgi:hypothetical protein